MDHHDEIGQLMVEEGGGITPTTWNPLDKSAIMALSLGDLRATAIGSNQYRGVRSVASSSTAKWYFEITAPASPTEYIIGIANSSVSLGTSAGVEAGATVYYGGGLLFSEGVQELSGLPTDSVTHRWSVDLGEQKIWLGDEGEGAGAWFNGGNPATGANPTFSGFPPDTYFVALWLFVSGNFSDADFGQSPAYAVPAGFTSVG